jgi:hypothetical protein
MQIVESTSWGVRSARISLRHPKSDKTITLFPMIHIGEQQFYDGVYQDALSHDVILLEGIRSPITTRITRSYRLIEGKIIGLVIQPKLEKPHDCQTQIVQSDLSPDEFATVWREIPFWQRLLIYVLSPAIGLARRRSATRSSLAKDMSFEDAPSQKELIDWSPEAGFLETAILHARDERLLEHIHDLVADPTEGSRSITVVYGAHHMRAVVRDLMGSQGFVCANARWLLVFAL